MALGEGQAHHAPVVHHEAHTLDLELLQEALEKTLVLVYRVSQRSGLARTSETREIGREAPGPLEELEPVIGVGRNTVQIQGRGRRADHRGGWRASPEDRQPIERL